MSSDQSNRSRDSFPPIAGAHADAHTGGRRDVLLALVGVLQILAGLLVAFVPQVAAFAAAFFLALPSSWSASFKSLMASTIVLPSSMQVRQRGP